MSKDQAGLKCPHCGTTLSSVLETRAKKHSSRKRATAGGQMVQTSLGCISRKRECYNGHTFFTEEWPVHPRALAGRFDAAITRMLNQGATWPQIRKKLGVSDAPIARIVRARKGTSK